MRHHDMISKLKQMLPNCSWEQWFHRTINHWPSTHANCQKLK